MSQFIRARLTLFFELEEHTCAFLRIGRCPFQLCGQRGINGFLHSGSIAKVYLSLDAADYRHEHPAKK